MLNRVTLTFVVDATEDEAWALAEGLASSAMKQNYREVNGFAQAVDARGNLLSGTVENPGQASNAMSTEIKTGGQAMSFGTGDGGDAITLGGEDGRSA